MKVFNFFKEILLIILGCLISAFGIACFLLPNKLSNGGFSGIATILYYLFDFKIGTTIIILNVPLFIIAYFKCGKRFFIKTIYSTILYSKFIDVLENTIFVEDRLLGSIYGGLFVGIGLALIFKAESSTGGIDLIAYITQGYKIDIKISNIITIIDSTIIIASIVIFKELEIGFYSFISIFIIGKMIDIIFEGINFCKIIYIISEKQEEIMKVINFELQRGATRLYGQGSYTQNKKTILMCVAARKDIEKIKNISKQIDPNAFIIITDAREVYGLGFKN